MYKVLLVDDEPEVIMAVIKKMDWTQLGFEVIGYAQNGEEALEMAEAVPPDVVMTDIKMPFMDGLTLSRKLKDIYAGLKVIIFSGFDEFEYAREAIKLEVEEYILKPMKLDELRDIFVRIRNLLDKERSEKVNIDKLKEYYMNSLPIMQDQFYIGLIEGRMDQTRIDNFKQNYQIKMDGPEYFVTVFQVYTKDGNREEIVEMNQELRNISIKQILDENLTEYDFKSFLYFEQIIHITSIKMVEEIKQYTDRVDKICKLVERMLGVQVVAGIGRMQKELVYLRLSYDGAKNAAFYRGVSEGSRATYIEELQPVSNDLMNYEQHDLQEKISDIKSEIKMGDKETLVEEIDKFVDILKEQSVTIPKLRIILMNVVTELFKLAGSYNIDITTIFGENLDMYQQILHFNTMEEVKNWLNEICLAVRRCISKERRNTANVIIDKAVKYIEENFSDSTLSIEKICSEINVSSAYFSTIFKRETGKTFLNYLTELRMEKAISLLDGTEEKTYIISEQVGYAEPNYFSYVFKKRYGMAPSKYRRIRLEQNGSKN